MDHVILHAVLDSLKVLAFVFIFNVLFSLFEASFTKKIEKSHKINPLTGSLIGLIPECGVSVISADLYVKEHISMGTLIAIFITCSDEAIPMILSNPSKALSVLPLLLIKFIIGFIVGYLVDIIYRKSKHDVDMHKDDCHHVEEIQIGCCHHEINNTKENKIKRHLIHPILHSLKLFLYVLAINFIFGTIIYLIGEETFVEILKNNKYFTPIYATLIGLIPNCASSVIITNLYIMGQISFGATIAGLITNAGLGMIVLLKNKNMIKKTIVIISILVLTALVSGYVINLIIGF